MARLVPNITLRSKQVALDMVPRVTLAQKLDSLSTLGNITGEMVLYEGAWLRHGRPMRFKVFLALLSALQRTLESWGATGHPLHADLRRLLLQDEHRNHLTLAAGACAPPSHQPELHSC